MQKTITLISIPVVILIFTLISGCEKDPLIMSYGEPAIFAELRRSKQKEQIIQNIINVSVGGTRLVPVVSINNDTLELEHYQRDDYAYLISEFRGILSVNPGDECELVVYHDEGEASATITLPGNFEITSPEEDSVLHQNKDFPVSWSSSEGAERYKLNIDLSYYYIDTSGTLTRFNLDTSFYTTTNITIPKERLFPPEVDSVDGGFGNISIYSESGPCIGHTIKGNVSGEGVGYFTAYNQTPERTYFAIGNAAIISVPFDPFDPGISPTEQFETHLEYLRTHDPNFIQFE
jgi:hypothetical protein